MIETLTRRDFKWYFYVWSCHRIHQGQGCLRQSQHWLNALGWGMGQWPNLFQILMVRTVRWKPGLQCLQEGMMLCGDQKRRTVIGLITTPHSKVVTSKLAALLFRECSALCCLNPETDPLTISCYSSTIRLLEVLVEKLAPSP